MPWLGRKHSSTVFQMGTYRKKARVCKMCVCCTRGFKVSVLQVPPSFSNSGPELETAFSNPTGRHAGVWWIFCGISHWHPLSLQCVENRQRNQPHWLSPCFLLSSDADRHAELSGSPLKSKSTRKPLACIIGYLGGYFLIEGKFQRTIFVPYMYLATINCHT